MPEEATIDSAPRDPRALSSMTNKQRVALYRELCDTAEKKLPPGVRAFKKLDGIKQVQYLLNYLLAYDRETAGYRVEQATLPVRTQRHSTNVKRMQQFAEEVEELLTSMMHSGHQHAAQIRFGDHGLLIIGFKPPPPQVGVFLHPAGAPPPQEMPGSPSPFEGMPAGAQEAFRRHFSTDLASKLYALVGRKREQVGKVTQDDVNKLVEEHTKTLDAEMLGQILSGLEDLMHEHDSAHSSGGADPTGCGTTTELKLLHVAVSQRLRTQLS